MTQPFSFLDEITLEELSRNYSKLLSMDKIKYARGFLIIQYIYHEFEIAQISWIVLTKENGEVQAEERGGII